eukprot:scaffold14086_cov131-Isochrysis_galbana.AAC.4
MHLTSAQRERWGGREEGVACADARGQPRREPRPSGGDTWARVRQKWSRPSRHSQRPHPKERHPV